MIVLKKTVFIFCFAFLTIANIRGAETFTVAVAPNFLTTFNEIKNAFLQQNKDASITVVSAASGKLATQIISGAPFDIFISADMKFPAQVAEKGFAIKGPSVYAVGKLILFSAKGADLSKGIFSVTNAEIKKIAIAYPQLAPYGRATVEALKNSGIYSIISNKFVFAENVSQAAQYAVTTTDAGFLPYSLLHDKNLLTYLTNTHAWTMLENGTYTPIKQGMILIKQKQESKSAAEFYKFLLSKEAQTIILKYGYSLPSMDSKKK